MAGIASSHSINFRLVEPPPPALAVTYTSISPGEPFMLSITSEMENVGHTPVVAQSTACNPMSAIAHAMVSAADPAVRNLAQRAARRRPIKPDVPESLTHR